MPSITTRLIAVAAAFTGLIVPAVALDCVRGGVSNTTAVRKTYPVPPITIYPLVGDFFNTDWSTIYSFNYSGVTHPATPPNSSQLAPPNATRTIEWQGYQFEEQLLFINDSTPIYQFELRWNLTKVPASKPYSDLIIDGYVQDFKVTSSCSGRASLLEWTVEYCSSNQEAAWSLFQNKTLFEADNLAMALNITGADDGTWDVGCAIPVSSTMTSSEMPMTSTAVPIPSSTGFDMMTTTKSHNLAAMVTAMPKIGAMAIAVAAAAVAL